MRWRWDESDIMDCPHRVKCMHMVHGEYLLFECLSLCVLVMSWSVNVHLLDEHVYVVSFLSKDRVPLIRDFHHGLFALRGSSIWHSV